MKAAASGLLVCAALCAAVPTARASDDDRVIGRLTRYGELTPARAGRVARNVTKEMSRAAGMTNEPNDPVRVALSRAMFGGAPTPPDKMSEAKMRLRLYAGLNEWALERMFPPRPGVVAGCQRDFGLGADECEALVAAAGRIALADAMQLGGGAPTAVAVAGGASMRAAPAWSPAPSRAAPPPSRFAKYDSGFRGAAAARPTFTAPPPRPAPAPVYAAPRPAPQPVFAPAPVAARPVVDQKAAYKARREAYLARQRAQMEERKAKMRSASGPEMRPKEETAAAAAPAPAAKPVAADEPAAVAAADAPPAEAAPAAEQPKAALDNDFLDGLLADPLGSN